MARRRRCLAGLTTSLAVLQWRPVAMLWLTESNSKSRCCCFKRRRERFFLFPSPLVFRFSFSFFVYQWFVPLSSLFFLNSLPCFKLPRVLSFLSLYFVSSLSILSVLSPFQFSFFFFLLCWRWVVFIGQWERGCPYYCPATVLGWLASGRGWQGAAPPVSHHEGVWGLGFWQSTHHEGVNEERTRKE